MSQYPDPNGLFRRLAAETDESATVRLFVQLCRSSPELRHWLWEDFARSGSTREKFAEALKDGDADLTRFADLTGESAAWRAERLRLRSKWSRREYGGLSFDELMQLLVRHQAGGIDLAAFLLASEWRRLGPDKTVAPLLLRGAAEFVAAAMGNGESHLLQHLEKAADLTKEFTDATRRRAVIGPSDWWKTHVLLYMVRHPSPAYRTRDLSAYLAKLGLTVTTRRIREFCTEHGIRRDMRAGRPAKRPPQRTG